MDRMGPRVQCKFDLAAFGEACGASGDEVLVSATPPGGSWKQSEIPVFGQEVELGATWPSVRGLAVPSPAQEWAPLPGEQRPSVARVGRSVDRKVVPIPGAVAVAQQWGSTRRRWGRRGSSMVRGMAAEGAHLSQKPVRGALAGETVRSSRRAVSGQQRIPRLGAD